MNEDFCGGRKERPASAAKAYWSMPGKRDADKYLLERQLEMIKIFYERKLLTKEQYEFEVQIGRAHV